MSSIAKQIEKVAEKGGQQVQLKPAEREAGAIPDFEAGSTAVAEQFPTQGYNAKDKKDAKYELLQDLQTDAYGGQPGATAFGVPQWSDDVLRWMEKKKRATVKAQFEQWFQQHFDKMSPTAKALARDLYPTFYRDRMKTLEMNASLLKQLAAIRLNGVQSKSDLLLQYAADTGQIDLHEIENLLHPESAERRPDGEFERGLFNPRRRFPGRADGAQRNHNASIWKGIGADAAPQEPFIGGMAGGRPTRAYLGI
jgi:hypothetical protein